MLPPPMARSLAIALAVTVLTSCARESENRSTTPPDADATAAEALLARSIAFHDPSGHWGRSAVAMTWTGTGDNGDERLALDMGVVPATKTFTLVGHYRGTRLDYTVTDERVEVRVDDSAEIPEALRDKLVLEREDGLFWRNYFGFLAGFPMNLRDPGTHLAPDVERTEFLGRTVDALQVTFDQDVGTDTWTFYFLPETAEVVGCRFTKADPESPGEYLVFEGLVEHDGLRLPRLRRWYMNDDDRFLGDDTITSLGVGT